MVARQSALVLEVEPDYQALRSDYRLRRVQRLIRDNPTRRISLDEAAEAAGLEPSYFSRLFKRSVRVTFSQYRSLAAVARAIELMKTTDYSLTQVSAMCGLGDLRSLERHFHRWTRRTPSAYRRWIRSRTYRRDPERR